MLKRVRLPLLLVLVLSVWAGPGAAQEDQGTLQGLAEAARRAWVEHDVAGLVGEAAGIQVHLPGAEPSVALGQAQAAATLAAFLRRTGDVEVAVAGRGEGGRGAL